MAIRVGEDIAICTPTLVSKGSLKPEDMCLVDFRAATNSRHQESARAKPDAFADDEAAAQRVATCHCHPPLSTAFAVVGKRRRRACCRSMKFFVPSASRRIARRFAGHGQARRGVDRSIQHHPDGNHGVVTWSHNNIEEAYWHGDYRGVLPHDCGGGTARQADPADLHRPADEGDILNIKKSLGFWTSLWHEGMRAVRQR